VFFENFALSLPVHEGYLRVARVHVFQLEVRDEDVEFVHLLSSSPAADERVLDRDIFR